MKIRKELESLKSLVKQKKELQRKIDSIKSEIFKYETVYLDLTQDTPVTKTADFYLNNKSEKKKYTLKDKDRIFSSDFPGN